MQVFAGFFPGVSFPVFPSRFAFAVFPSQFIIRNLLTLLIEIGLLLTRSNPQ